MNLLLKSAIIVHPTDGKLHRKKRDILIKKGRIEKIAAKIAPESGTKVITFKNLHVSIGWFDSGVCFGEPGYEERETIANGLFTAAKSGFTDVILNSDTHPVPDSSSDIVFLKNVAESQATNLYPLGTLTSLAHGESLAELYDMKQSGAVGFYDYQSPIKNSNLLKIALQYCQNFDGLVYSFPLDMQIAGKGVVNEGPAAMKLGLKGIPALSEELQIARDLYILEYAGGRLHIPTITTAGAVKLISEAKKKGLDVSCSVAIHHLWFTDEVLEGFDTNFKVLPPLRNKTDIKALLKGVKDGVVDFVTTDHSPMDIEQKRVEFDNAAFGTLGLESAFGVLQQLFDLDQTISILTRGRERFGIPLSALKPGEMANLCLFDPTTEITLKKDSLYSTSKNNAFEGTLLKGSVHGIINGEQILI